ncbi:MAG: YHS domain-containing protein [Gammaproteobacteria bacterium]|nr:YHS domain-containing protein [Gammaproteobacteria bacterium]HJP34492.1 YHS domain-containing protein [Gammaproteobacteria bacterium]
MLKRADWYDIARDTNWTPSYVSLDEFYPPEMSDTIGVEPEKWESYDEPYKTTYREYVKVQREKDAGAYSVKAALSRMKFCEEADPGWLSTQKAHYGAIAKQEYAAGMAEARMARFGKAPGMRNMATFGLLDEIRHSQIQLYFPHEFVSKDRQYDWAHRAMHTNDWVSIAARHAFADMFSARDAVSIAIMLTFAFETGFTNMQFLGLAADAAEAGDYSFANLISSIQTDEARHAQIGAPALKILIENGHKEEAQQRTDIAFWRAWRIFSVLTGPIMDYYTPLDRRESSFKEFMEEWIVTQFDRNMRELGLDRPWYWDIFLEELNDTHHGMHMGAWYWRPTVWWNPAAGASPADREWLEEKYPGWNDTWGQCWDVITENLRNGREELTLPETLPIICNMSGLPILGPPGSKWGCRDYYWDYKGRRYHFGSEPDRWIFQQEPERYAGHLSIVDRFLAGLVQPATIPGVLAYMGLEPEEYGHDAHDYAWAFTDKEDVRKAS